MSTQPPIEPLDAAGDEHRFAVAAHLARTPGMLRLVAGLAVFSFSEFASWLALTVYAFERGGASEVAVISVVMLLPAIVATPLLAALLSRLHPARALTAGFVAQSLSFALTAVGMVSGSWLAVYGAGTAATLLLTCTRPLSGTAFASVAREPDELVAANVGTDIVQRIGEGAGPLVAGLVIAARSPAWVMGGCAGLLAIAAVGTLGLRDCLRPVNGHAAGSVLGGLRASASLVRRDARVRWLLGAIAVSALVAGAVDNLSVSMPDVRLSAGAEVAGLLGAMFGFGSMLGAAATTLVMGGRKLSPVAVAGGAAAAIALVGLGGVTNTLLAGALFCLAGAGRAVVALLSNVGLQRAAPAASCTVVLGVVEATQLVSVAVGSTLVAWLLSSFGFARALGVLGVGIGVATAVVILRLRSLRLLDSPPPAARYRRIAADALFRPLPLPSLERLAADADERSCAAGDTIIREGEDGDLYYLLVSGRVSVRHQGSLLREMGPGESFGELALLRSTPRAADIVAVEAVEVLVISRDEFLGAVTGHPLSAVEADTVVARYLA